MSSYLVKRQAVPNFGNDHLKYREYLRVDFWYSCAYCSISEREAEGLGFQIDHHRPVNVGGSSSYDNLMYACTHCNRRKEDIWPSPQRQAAGYRYLRPDADDFTEHLEPDGDQVKPRTKPAEFTTQVIGLNRAPLRHLRASRANFLSARDALIVGTRALVGQSLDRLPPEIRGLVLKLRAQAKQLVDEYDTIAEEALSAFNHSPLLDPDPSAAQHTAERRKYLKSIGVVSPRARSSGGSAPGRSRSKRGRGRRP